MNSRKKILKFQKLTLWLQGFAKINNEQDYLNYKGKMESASI